MLDTMHTSDSLDKDLMFGQTAVEEDPDDELA